MRPHPHLVLVPGMKRDPAPLALGPAEPDPATELGLRAATGDAEALEPLLAMLAPTLLRGVRAVVGTRACDVEDVLQESLIALVQALPAFRGEGTVLGYAMRIAIRTGLVARRRARREQTQMIALEHSARPGLRPVPWPSEEVMAARRQELLRSLLDELPESQAETLALRLVLGYSLKEVALATGAPVNTVRSRLRLGLEALRRRIEQDRALFRALKVAP